MTNSDVSVIVAWVLFIGSGVSLFLALSVVCVCVSER